MWRMLKMKMPSVLGMWLDWRHADAGVGIGMPALVLVKNEDWGYAKSQKKTVFAVFVFCKKFQKKKVFARKHNEECELIIDE